MALKFGPHLICLAALLLTVRARSYYGKNICSVVNDKPICCFGWSLDDTNLHCSIPVCTGQCEIIGGRCIKPDTCLCPGGYLAYSCFTDMKRAESQYCSITCRNGGTCKGSKCTCPYGFYGERCEVASCPNDCSSHGSCGADGRCSCASGYSGADCSVETKQPCYRSITRGLCRSGIPDVKTTRKVCCNSVGQAWGNPCTRCTTSRCDKGYMYSLSQRTCVDIDECREMYGICGSGSCRNSAGGFKCVCPQGLEYNDKTFACESIYDVCRRKPKVCGQGKCVSQGIGYRCQCFNGYRASSDGKTCVSTFQYLRFDMCRYNRGYLCHNGQCVPQGRSYKCRCNRGYQASPDGRSCEKEIDVCRLYGSSVCENGRCKAVANKDYRCECNSGFEVSPDRKKCMSTCDRYGDSICPNGRCVPIGTSGYECQCNQNFYQTLNRKMCVRSENEQRTVCDYYSLCTNGRCIPRGRSYRCECNKDYQSSSDGKSCKLAPQKKRDHICDIYGDYYCPNARCVPVLTSYRCECKAGFEMTMSGRCEKPAQRSANSKQVSKRKDTRRKPRDYCATYSYLCGNGKCISTSNYFYCECNPGFQAVDEKRRCRKVEKKPAKLSSGLYNFCQHYRSECQGGTCHNEPTSYWCTCLPKFTWDDRRLRCVPSKPRRLLSDEWASYADTRQKSPNWRQNVGWKYSTCEKMGRDVCGNGYCVDQGSSFTCRCKAGYESARHNKRCVDINECDVRPNVCWQGSCINSLGSYSCQCLKGYKMSHVNREPMCVDRNECEESNPCINGICRNTWGSYKCVCYDGYQNDVTGTQCIKNGIAAIAIAPAMIGVSAKEPMVSDWGRSDSCAKCLNSCLRQTDNSFRCDCPPHLTRLGKSDLCTESKSVAQYTFDIQMEEPAHSFDFSTRRHRRSVPDTLASKHKRARLILKSDIDVDHFLNSMTTLYKNSSFYKIVKLGDTAISDGGRSNTVVDIHFV